MGGVGRSIDSIGHVVLQGVRVILTPAPPVVHAVRCVSCPEVFRFHLQFLIIFRSILF